MTHGLGTAGLGAREVAWWLRSHTTFAEDPSSVPIIHAGLAAHNCLQFQLQDDHSPLVSQDVYTQKHISTQKLPHLARHGFLGSNSGSVASILFLGCVDVSCLPESEN